MNSEHGTVCQLILEHQIRLLAPSSVIKPTSFSSSLRCCWLVGSAPFVRRRCDCLASSAPFTNIHLLTYGCDCAEGRRANGLLLRRPDDVPVDAGVELEARGTYDRPHATDQRGGVLAGRSTGSQRLLRQVRQAVERRHRKVGLLFRSGFYVCSRVPPGRGSSWNLGRPFSRPGKSWKITKVMENDGNVMEFLLLHWAIL